MEGDVVKECRELDGRGVRARLMVVNGMDMEEVGCECASSRCAGRAAEVHGTCLLVTRLFSGAGGSAQSKYRTL